MQKKTMQALQKTSFLDANSASYLDQLYETFLTNPLSVPKEWRNFFEETLQGKSPESEVLHSEVRKQFQQLASHPLLQSSVQSSSQLIDQSSSQLSSQNAQSSSQLSNQFTSISEPASEPKALSRESKNCEKALMHERKQTQVHALIDAYRLLGHLHADLDPLKLRIKPLVPELMLSFYGLAQSDLNTVYNANSLSGPKERSLKRILEDLQMIYCGTAAFEFMHIPDSPERAWVQMRVEDLRLDSKLSPEIKCHLLERVVAAEGLEKYLGAKYPGAKRFSLEGCDTLVIALDELIQYSGQNGAKEIVMGMAHRGRLNILTNILGKFPKQLFDEFEGKLKTNEQLESGDVKYHQGFSSNIETEGGVVHIALAFNPSHLEIVSPVVCGSVRARQERRNDIRRNEVIAILMHGDAAFAGQGVVMETLNMSKTRGYCIGGTIHIVVNNQIGFTTSDPEDARSTLYCSDIGKMLEIPIFHVNADDPESVYSIVQLALDYREKFKKDVIIDLVGYRRQGHNEADEPAVTQPVMYHIIRKLPTIVKLYGDQLIKEGILTEQAVGDLVKNYRDILEAGQSQVARKLAKNVGLESVGMEGNGKNNEVHHPYSQDWEPYFTKDWRAPVNTGFPMERLKFLGQRLQALPPNFELHSVIRKGMNDRGKMVAGELPIDWGCGEILAYATLLDQGYAIRLTGQDSGRGTFFHRQAILHNQTDNSEYIPLAHLTPTQAPFYIYDSLLSEEAVVGFEYGYSATAPKTLVIWEAQFGDFANNAQVVIDQFISSGQQKWGRLSGLTLFLPHGYEGQGPEHSSARIERYLQLCAESNIQVCVPSTPAQIFHMLRRQMIRVMRKPLIVITPKSLLRHKLAVSSLQDFAEGRFFPVISEIDKLTSASVQRIILCSGKIYYELLAARREQDIQDIAIIRIEQLYPFPERELKAVLHEYERAKDIVWCQEEPQNQGAWYSSNHHVEAVLDHEQRLRYVGREPAAAPAVGYHHLHQEQQKKIVADALKSGQVT